MNKTLKKMIPILYILLISITFFAICLKSIDYKSATFDEPIILASGYNCLTNFNNNINSENPPFLKSIIALPILFMNIKEIPQNNQLDYTYNANKNFSYGRTFLFNNNFKKILKQCRSLNIIFAILCAYFIYLTLRLFISKIWSLLGFTLFLLEPNIIANCRLATLDIGITFFMLAAVYFMFLSIKYKKSHWIAFTILSTTLALLSKYTAVLLFPIFILQLAAYFLSKPNRLRLLLCLKLFLLIVVLSAVLLNIIYMNNDLGLCLFNRNFKSPLLQFLSMPILKNIPILIPLSYLKGFDIVSFFNVSPFSNVFMGKYYPNGESWWYYYIVISVLKIPIPILVLSGAGLLSIIFKVRQKYKSSESFEYYWKYIFFLIPPIIIFLVFSFLSKRQLGIRYILPAFPYLIMLAVAGACYIYSKARLFKIALSLLLLWLAVENIRIYPHYLAYFNQFIGGSKNAGKYFTGSNLDWGQDLPGLRKWLNENNNPPTVVLYFGQTPPELYNMKSTNKVPKLIAVSSSLFFTESKSRNINILKQKKPIHNIGYTIYIYENNM